MFRDFFFGEPPALAAGVVARPGTLGRPTPSLSRASLGTDHQLGLALHLKHELLDAKLCARQLLHIQSPLLKLSGAAAPEEAAPVAAAACSPPALRCLHLKHALLDAKLCARHPAQIQPVGCGVDEGLRGL